jgi:hypothetical protein
LTGLTQTAVRPSEEGRYGGSNLDATNRAPDWGSVIARC